MTYKNKTWKFVKPLKDKSSILLVEKEWGIKLPETFIELVINYNSGVPEKTAFDTEFSVGKSFGELLNFNLENKDNVLVEYKAIKNQLPPDVFPFAADPGGNYICFDYRIDTKNPQIVFWNHEERFIIEDDQIVNPDIENEFELYVIEPVSSSLNAFLDKLYSIEVDDDFEGFELL